jgi:uncharacterized protein
MTTAVVARSRSRAWSRVLLWILGGLALSLLGSYLLVGAVIVTQLMVVERRPVTTTPGTVDLPYEDVQVISRDGTEIAAWHIPNETAQSAILLVHGKDSNRALEFGGHFMSFARELHQAGYAVMMMDLRGHGESGGRYFTLGDQERWDVSAAVDWLHTQGYRSIGVLGVSLGGGSSAEAAAVNDRIDALVLDSVYPDLNRLLEREFPRQSGLPTLFLPGTRFMGRILVNGNVDSIRPAIHVARSGVPLLVIFGDRDDLIPVEEFYLFAEENPYAELWELEGGYHAGIYHAAHDDYLRRVLSFFQEHLGGGAGTSIETIIEDRDEDAFDLRRRALL